MAEPMNREMWKFPLPVGDIVQINMPKCAVVRHVHEQGGWACVWAEVYQDNEYALRYFRVAGTGHPLGRHRMDYKDTFHTQGLEFHVYELVNYQPPLDGVD
jgi:hypothetical protein